MKSLLREPLVHFVILGALLFVGHALWDKHVERSSYTITVSADEIERQALIFAGENRRQPSDEDIQALLFAYVEEQALMREAQRLGLGQDDTIIRRRLAQKMRFMLEDTTAPTPPKEEDLKAWFESNREKFKTAEQRSFYHVFISPESHGDQAEGIAKKLLAEINVENWEGLGDPFIMRRKLANLSREDVTRMFGPSFSTQVFATKPQTWQGPFESSYGLHLIYVNKVAPEVNPTFEQARSAVVGDMMSAVQRQRNQDRLSETISKYKVVVEDLEE